MSPMISPKNELQFLQCRLALDDSIIPPTCEISRAFSEVDLSARFSIPRSSPTSFPIATSKSFLVATSLSRLPISSSRSRSEAKRCSHISYQKSLDSRMNFRFCGLAPYVS